MPKNLNVANRHRLWIFGRSIDFNIVTTNLNLGPADYATVAGAPRRAPKRQITLHCTAGRGSAEQVIGWWNDPASGAAGAHWVVERTGTAQIARGAAHARGELRDDRSFLDPTNAASRLVDAVRVADDDMIVYHGGDVNRNSIGIEIVNVGDGWYIPTVADEPSLAGRHHPLATCPAPINIAGAGAPPNLKCNHARPQDLNRFIRENTHLNSHFQSFEDEQYSTLILLLRYLCITHRIPRQFLGHTTDEVFRHWLHQPAGDAAMRRVNRRTIFNFRGIFHHRNCHPNKACPGVLHRSRLYRGISDEWWLPVSLDGQARDYYSGPFEHPPWAAGTPTRPALFRPRAGGRMEATVYRDADIDALAEARSYYDVDQIEHYYAAVETGRGGLFPVGLNKVWHGGVHFPATGTSDWVYAAASGTIVAARVTSHAGTERERNFGSQRFVLIKHAVHLATEADPGGFGQRINYTADPFFIFTLYMHLAPLADPAAEHDDNPPWFNAWRRRNPGVAVGLTADGERGRVFAPDIPVLLGDVLGRAGLFRGERVLHFEVIGHRDRELRMAPWDQPDRRVEDTNQNLICDVRTLDRFLRDRAGDGLDLIDLLEAAPQLRTTKAMHLSSWALSEPAQIDPLIPHPDRRGALWPHFARFSWVAEAARASAHVRDHLGASGMFWHYHPVTFMQHVNRLVLGENREIPEAPDPAVNVLISEDYFLTDFVSWNAGTSRFDPAAADGANLVPQDGQVFNFSRRSVSCQEPGAHTAPYATAQRTRVALALIEVLQKIREHFDDPIDLKHALVCWDHAHRRVTGRGPHEEDFRVVATLGTHAHQAAEIQAHEHGLAVDFAPHAATPASCRRLWQSTGTIVDLVNRVYSDSCGMPTAANMPEGYQAVAFRAHPATADTKLRAVPAQALTATEAAEFEIHLALVEAPHYHPPLVPLTVTLEQLEILDDQDTFCAGEWRLHAHVNGDRVGSLSRSVRTGDRIALTWRRKVFVNPVWGELLRVRVGGSEVDVFVDDSIGTVVAEFGEASTPAWGVGRHTVESSNRSFRLTFRVVRG